MPCYFPLQATFSNRSDGKKSIKFSNANARLFRAGVPFLGDNNISLPCGRCMGCRVERSRQWAVRIMHEAQLYEDNCFLTLTFDDEHLSKECDLTPGGYSLNKSHVQNFVKRLRQRFDDRRIRVFYCGEYGDDSGRPHYHLCVFNLDFKDKQFYTRKDSFLYYNSPVLSVLWPYGHAVISDLTFDSAAYVARYCTKKINGSLAEEHYQGRLPEFAHMSLKPGIARDWLDKFGKSDVFSFDEVVVAGCKTKPPRYYDKYLESIDPDRFNEIKSQRDVRAELKKEDSTFDRLAVRLKCMESRMKKLIRSL